MLTAKQQPEKLAVMQVYVGNFGNYEVPELFKFTKKGLPDKRQKNYSEVVDWIDAEEANAARMSVERLKEYGYGYAKMRKLGG